MFKINGYGNTIEIQGLGADIQNFNTIENLTYNDEVVAYDLSRPLSNLASNDVLLYSFLEKLARQLYNKNGIFQNSLNQQFDFSTSVNTKTINFGVLGYKTFVTVSPGIAGFGFNQASQPGWLIVNNPNIAEAERQLAALLSIRPEDDLEYVKIKYNPTYNRYKMRIVKCTPGGEQLVYDFLNPDFPSSTFDNDSIEGGYKNFVDIVSLLYTDTTSTPPKNNLLSDFYYKATPSLLSKLVCQPTFHITENGIYYLKINSSGLLECNKTPFGVNDFPLHTFSINGCNTANPAYTYISDNRVFYTDKEIYTKKIDFNTTAESDDVNWIFSDVSGSDTIIKHRIGRDISDKILFEYYNGTTATPIAEFKGDLSSTFHGDVFTNAHTTLGNLVSADTLTLNSTILSDLIFNDANRYIKLGGSAGSTTTRTLFLQNDGAGMASLTVEGDITSSNGKLITANTTSYVFDTVATTLHFAGDATTLNVGYDGTAATSLTNINTGALTGAYTKSIYIGTGGTTGSTTTIDMGSIVGTGSITLRNYTIGLGTSTANATTVTLGGAITGNTFKVSGVQNDTNAAIHFTTDINTGKVNLFDSLTTGTLNIANNISTGIVNIATNGASTINLGGTGATIVLGETSGAATLRTSSGVTTANVFDTIATTVYSFGAATTLDIGYDGTAAASTTNINTGALTGTFTKAINIGTAGTTGSTTTITMGSNIGGTITALGAAINLGVSNSTLATTLTLGSAITGNTFKLAGVQNDVNAAIHLTTDINTGTVNIFNSLTTGTLNIATTITTGTVNIATAGASTVNIGKNDAAAKVYIGGSGAIIDIRAASGTANVFNTNSTTVNAFNAATAVDLAKAATTFNIATTPAAHQTISIGATAANSFNQIINVGTGLTTTTQTINIGTGLTTGVQTINIGTGASMSAKQLINVGSSASSTAEFNILNVTEVDNTTTPTTAALIVGGGAWIKKKLYVAGTSTLVSDVTITGDLAVNGGDIITTITNGTFNFINTGLTGTLKIGGAATTIEIGNTTTSPQNIYIGNATDATSTQTIVLGKATNTAAGSYVSVAIATDATSTSTGALRVAGGVGIAKKLYVAGDFSVATTMFTVASGSGNTVVAGTLDVNGASIKTDDATFDLLTNNSNQIVNFGGTGATGYVKVQSTLAATAYTAAALVVAGGIGAAGKIIANSDIVTNSGVLITANASSFIFDTVATSLNIGSKAETLNIAINPAAKQTINLGTTNTGYEQVVNIGTSIATGAQNINIGTALTTGVQTINIGTNASMSAAQAINIGAANNTAGVVKIFNATTSTTTTSGALQVIGGVGIGGNLNVGGTTGLTGNTTITGDLAVNGGDITTTAATFNLLNSVGTQLNIGTSSATIAIGSASSTVTMGNDLFVTGNQVRIAAKYEFNYDSVTNTLDLVYVG